MKLRNFALTIWVVLVLTSISFSAFAQRDLSRELLVYFTRDNSINLTSFTR